MYCVLIALRSTIKVLFLMPLQGFLAFKSSLFTLSTTAAAAAAIKDPYKDTAYSKT